MSTLTLAVIVMGVIIHTIIISMISYEVTAIEDYQFQFLSNNQSMASVVGEVMAESAAPTNDDGSAVAESEPGTVENSTNGFGQISYDNTSDSSMSSSKGREEAEDRRRREAEQAAEAQQPNLRLKLRMGIGI